MLASGQLLRAGSLSRSSVCFNITMRHLSSSTDSETAKEVIYQSPFAPVTLRLKRVSIVTAALGLVGMPALVALNSGSVPALGQLAVGGTASLAAVGSTMLLNFCVTPYVHEMTKEGDSDPLFTATTANMLGMLVKTEFKPADVTSMVESGSSRPFVNFFANGKPMYIHGELFDDKLLLKQLLKRPLTKSEIEGRAGDKSN